MFDSFEPFKVLNKIDFIFHPQRFETWMEGKMVSNGKTSSKIEAKVFTENSSEKIEITFIDSNLNSELSTKNIFDVFISSNDRLQLIIIPDKTNVENSAIIMFKMIIGATRSRKDFNRNEPYCCNLFLQNGTIQKITFTFSNPEKLIEFYSLNLDFVFKSTDHIRHENGRNISGGGAIRAVKIEPNKIAEKGFLVTIYNLQGNHPVWQNNVQMAPKQMKIIQQANDMVVLRGYGYDVMGASFSDYGMTVYFENEQVKKCILHMHDRSIDIEYLP